MQSRCIRKVKVCEGGGGSLNINIAMSREHNIDSCEGIPPCPPVSHNIAHVGRFSESSGTFYYISVISHHILQGPL